MTQIQQELVSYFPCSDVAVRMVVSLLKTVDQMKMSKRMMMVGAEPDDGRDLVTRFLAKIDPEA